MKQMMLTTSDNPYNPFDDFENWYSFDTQKKYFTSEYLARIANTSEDLSEIDEIEAINEAIDSILLLNPLGIYKKVEREIEIETKNDTT